MEGLYQFPGVEFDHICHSRHPKDLRKLRTSDKIVCYDAVTARTEYFCQNACSCRAGVRRLTGKGRAPAARAGRRPSERGQEPSPRVRSKAEASTAGNG